jgi:hypothetical protein
MRYSGSDHFCWCLGRARNSRLLRLPKMEFLFQCLFLLLLVIIPTSAISAEHQFVTGPEINKKNSGSGSKSSSDLNLLISDQFGDSEKKLKAIQIFFDSDRSVSGSIEHKIEELINRARMARSLSRTSQEIDYLSCSIPKHNSPKMVVNF